MFATKPFQNVCHLHIEKSRSKKRGIKDYYSKNFKLNEDNTDFSDNIPYVTSEKYHALNKSTSDKSVVRSTSTLFYDLDKLVKRHSYHCITEVTVLNNTVIDNNKRKHQKKSFGPKSGTVAQECATKNQPNLKVHDSIEINAKKVSKKQYEVPDLLSEIRLNDEEDNGDLIKHEDNHHQKFWSFAKYQTEYTEPIKKEKKCKKKDRGKRTEDPCPCQLFSYACPCTNKKSLTELAKNSKSMTFTDQVTSTAKFVTDAVTNYKHSKSRKSKCNHDYSSELIDSTFTDLKKTYEVIPFSDNQVNKITNHRYDSKEEEKYTSNTSKIRKKSKQIICPNCKQKLDILSIAEEEDLKPNLSPIIHNSIRSSHQESIKNFNEENLDICHHNPPCEQVPICQILPTNNNSNNSHFNSIHVENVSALKHNPRMIRITKACRHHPPCTVVPSCQRINVLKNNCEYIPPCLHRPRCINLPLCVPFSKNFYNDDNKNRPEELDGIDYNLQYREHDDPHNSCVDHQFHTTRNTCEYLSEYTPRFVFNTKTTSEKPNFYSISPKNISCKCCLSNKSCQYDCTECQCTPSNKIKEDTYDEEIVYIRDVGCQFRNKNFSPQDSLLYSKSSSTLYLDTIKVGNFYNQYHTLRYEDKCTNPISGEELSMSTFTSSSLEIDIHCPSHGKKSSKGYTKINPISTSPIIAAFIHNPTIDYNLQTEEITQNWSKSKVLNAYPTKSSKCFTKGRHKKVFHERRRRTSTAKQKYKSNSKKSFNVTK